MAQMFPLNGTITIIRWYSLYAYDNDDSFPQSISGNTGVSMYDAWILGATIPYYEDVDLRMCPSVKVLNEPENRVHGGPFSAWGPFTGTLSWWDPGAVGSYGFNDWCADPPPGFNFFWGLESANAVRKITTQGASLVPIALDSVYVEIAPYEDDPAPPDPPAVTKAYPNAYFSTDAIQLPCIDRHNKGINAVFVDMSARHVGIKELWRLKWHKNFDQMNTLPGNGWQPWMAKYKDY